jgi:hypothetical protein
MLRDALGLKGAGKELLEELLSVCLFPPVVQTLDGKFVGFVPFVCSGVFDSEELALQSLAPFLSSSSALPEKQDHELRAKPTPAKPLNFVEMFATAPLVARFVRPNRFALLTPSDFKRPVKVRFPLFWICPCLNF